MDELGVDVMGWAESVARDEDCDSVYERDAIGVVCVDAMGACGVLDGREYLLSGRSERLVKHQSEDAGSKAARQEATYGLASVCLLSYGRNARCVCVCVRVDRVSTCGVELHKSC